MNYLAKFTNNYFVKIGNFKEETLDSIIVNNYFSKIYNLETSSVFYESYKSKFNNNTNVEFVINDTKYNLSNLINPIDEPITFWLNNDWSDKEKQSSILEILQQIKSHHIKNHTIIIDDINLIEFNNKTIKVEDIVEKLKQINPNYNIRFTNQYNDDNTTKDILVAFIEIKMCIHTYLTHCATNSQPPGFADFIRGTCALFMFCKIYNFTLKMDNSHPIYQYLKPCKHIIKNSNNTNVVELIPNRYDYNTIYSALECVFKQGYSFTTLTNSFYSKDNNGNLYNFGPLSEDCKTFLKEILNPSEYLQDRINNIFKSFNLDKDAEYYVIHVRSGDKSLHTNECVSDHLFNLMNNKIDYYLNIKNKPIILLTDSSDLGTRLRDYPRINKQNFIYWDNCKVHLGDLRGSTEAVSDTLVDFFIMKHAKQIYYLHDSGFSRICSLIYDIEYNPL